MTLVIIPAVGCPVGAPQVRPLTDETEGWPLLATLVRTCSPATLARRFLLSSRPDPEDVLVRYRRYLLAGVHGGALRVAVVDSTPIGLLNVVAVGERTADLALLVTDDWQRHGVGRLLAESVVLTRAWRGWTLRATMQPDNLAVRALLRRLPVTPRLVSASPGELEYEIEPTGRADDDRHGRR
jgi:GNAT superfamily N-acetyltransferase